MYCAHATTTNTADTVAATAASQLDASYHHYCRTFGLASSGDESITNASYAGSSASF